MEHQPHWRHFPALVTGLWDRHSPVFTSRGSFGVAQGPSNLLMNLMSPHPFVMTFTLSYPRRTRSLFFARSFPSEIHFETGDNRVYASPIPSPGQKPRACTC